jgi:hypothetical protein
MKLGLSITEKNIGSWHLRTNADNNLNLQAEKRGEWRALHYQELGNLNSSPNIVRGIKLKWTDGIFIYL